MSGCCSFGGVEECLARNFKDGVLPSNVHLYVGEEAIAVGVCAHLTDRDWITSTHRGHGHFLAKGGEPEALFAEIYGRGSGICKGFGGTMHVADFSKGIVGANGIVAAGIPIATGAALAAQLDGDGRVAVAFFGDGASNRGVLMESLNIATLWRLPLVFVCENNGFCEFSPTETVTAGAIHARAVGIRDPLAADRRQRRRAGLADGRCSRRSRTEGRGPVLHRGDAPIACADMTRRRSIWLSEPYRTEEEVARWREMDPLPRFADRLQRDGVADAAEARRNRGGGDAARRTCRAGAATRECAGIARSLAGLSGQGRRGGSRRKGECVMAERRFIQAINDALIEEMERDPRIILFGEDIKVSTSGDTGALQARFGASRVRNTPISEETMSGMAVGAAAAGRPVVLHMMFANFLYAGFDGIANQMTKLPFMTGGQIDLPLTVLCAYGGGASTAAQHSDTPYSMLMNLGCLNVIVPVDPGRRQGPPEDPRSEARHRRYSSKRARAAANRARCPTATS